MRLRAALWLFPVAFLVHDGEEILTMPGWIERNGAALDRIAAVAPVVRRAVESLATTTTEVAAAVAFELVFISAATLLLTRSPRRSLGLYCYAAVLGAFAVHSLTHVAQAVVFGGYTPGVVSAVLVIPPASVYLYRRLFDAGLLTVRSAVASAAVGVVLLVPIVLLAHRVGRGLT